MASPRSGPETTRKRSSPSGSNTAEATLAPGLEPRWLALRRRAGKARFELAAAPSEDRLAALRPPAPEQRRDLGRRRLFGPPRLELRRQLLERRLGEAETRRAELRPVAGVREHDRAD